MRIEKGVLDCPLLTYSRYVNSRCISSSLGITTTLYDNALKRAINKVENLRANKYKTKGTVEPIRIERHRAAT